jgi:hypothetical protein
MVRKYGRKSKRKSIQKKNKRTRKNYRGGHKTLRQREEEAARKRASLQLIAVAMMSVLKPDAVDEVVESMNPEPKINRGTEKELPSHKHHQKTQRHSIITTKRERRRESHR